MGIMAIVKYAVSADKRSVAAETGEGTLILCGIEENILRCVYTTEKIKEEAFPSDAFALMEKESLMERDREKKAILTVEEFDNALSVETERLTLYIDRMTGRFSWSEKETGRILLEEGYKELQKIPVYAYSTGGEEPKIRRVRTVDGDRNFVENLKPVLDHEAYRAKLWFQFQEGEKIHGLGQGEDGIYNHRNHTEYLYQHNMRIPAPVLLSDQGYGILADCPGLMTFSDDGARSFLCLDTVPKLDYYFIAGKDAEEIIRGFRRLTGKAAMLPKWAFGYIQSKERYETQEEILSVAEEYRRRGVGLDCIVQDWKTWQGDDWGQKTVDKERYPDLPGMNEKLHRMHVHSMVSIWPNMNYDTPDCREMQKNGFLLLDLATYNAFIPEARRLYWEQASRELFARSHDDDGKEKTQGGFDSWWCDSTEPFSGPDWGGEKKRPEEERFSLVGEEHKKFLGAERANLYALAHAKGIYENQRRTDSGKRVLNLTRSGYPGIQKYGTMLWSGDITATWGTMRRQITEGLNMAMSGFPYWTLDIGGFFTVKEKWQNRGCGCNTDPAPKWFWQGDYEDGTADLGYRELYTRWIEFGVFLPMFRSHGTDTPREIWNFGKEGEPFYEAIKRAIALRYRLMPYIYSLAGHVRLFDTVMMRSLLFDFPEDSKAAEMDSEYMFGKDLLICPVTEPMYYEKGSRRIDREKTWKCYLPEGTEWYEFVPFPEEDNEGRWKSDAGPSGKYAGGQEILASAELSHIPVFVRAGAILCMEAGLTYADEASAAPMEIHIYPGSDGEFLYYEDDGDGYGYEKGRYNVIRMEYRDDTRTFTIGPSENKVKNGLNGRRCAAVCEGHRVEFVYEGKQQVISLDRQTDYAE